MALRKPQLQTKQYCEMYVLSFLNWELNKFVYLKLRFPQGHLLHPRQASIEEARSIYTPTMSLTPRPVHGPPMYGALPLHHSSPPIGVAVQDTAG